MKSPASSSSDRKSLIAIAALASILALFFATKDSIHQHILGLRITWGKNLWWKAMEWYAWGLFAPFIFKVCRRLDFSAAPLRTVASHLVCGSVAAVLHCCVLTTGARIESEVLQTGFSWAYLFKNIFANHFHENVLTYAAIVSVWYALDFHNRFRERERRAWELESRLTQARLLALKTQLHPHFLFNTLNGVSALIYENPKAAHRMLVRLSELLRMSLHSSDAPEATLHDELEFCRRYLDLEQIRLGDRLAVEFDIPADTLEAQVPTLLLQPILENAIKHAIAPFSRPGFIHVRARRNNETLDLRVQDNGPGLAAGTSAPEGAGIGLKNVRARLMELYGRAHSIEFKKGEPQGLVVEITIPFRTVATHEVPPITNYEDSHLNRG